MLIILLVILVIYIIYAILPFLLFKLKYKLNRKKNCKKIYLTFDDGPSIYTEELLDLLKNEKISASFFCVASFAKEYPNTIKRMQEEGHVIGLHTYNHESALLASPFKTNKDFKDSLEIMKSLNQKVMFFRPSWGHINLWTLFNLKKYNLKLILWHVMAEDWQGFTTKEEIQEKLLQRIKGGDIICLHDGRGENNAPKRTIEALKEVIPTLKKEGYIFETVDDYEK